jgi:hypothetical protein
MAGGRPTKYEDQFAEQAAKLCRLGATNDDLASFFNVAPSTIDNWMADKPEFLGAINEAKAEADALVERRLFERATGYSHPAVKIMSYEGVSFEHEYTERYPPETTAAIFWLKNRQPARWRDKQEIEHSGDPAFLTALEASRERARKA